MAPDLQARVVEIVHEEKEVTMQNLLEILYNEGLLDIDPFAPSNEKAAVSRSIRGFLSREASIGTVGKRRGLRYILLHSDKRHSHEVEMAKTSLLTNSWIEGGKLEDEHRSAIFRNNGEEVMFDAMNYLINEGMLIRKTEFGPGSDQFTHPMIDGNLVPGWLGKRPTHPVQFSLSNESEQLLKHISETKAPSMPRSIIVELAIAYFAAYFKTSH